jgi:LCP family protein required for cell wall assembly
VSGSAGAALYFSPAIAAAFQDFGHSIHHQTLPSASAGGAGTGATAAASPVASAAPIGTSGTAFTVLLLGSDNDAKFSGNEILTQSMILARVDPETKQVTMLSIPRDLYVPFWRGGSGQIDGAYSYGQAGGAIATVQQDFGVHIDDYIWIGLLGLVKLIDAIGGVDVVTSNPVVDDYYPDDLNSNWPYDYQRVAVLGGPQHLDGVHAMQYVRSRHNDYQSDIGRSKRQQQVLLAIRKKAKQVSSADIPKIAAALGGEIKTSISISKVAELIPLAASFDNPDSITSMVMTSPLIHGGCPDGSLCPDWPAILYLVRQYFP